MENDEPESDSDTEAGTAVADTTIASVLPITKVPSTFAWDEHPEIDPYKSSWLPDFSRQCGLLVDTTAYKPGNYFKLFFQRLPSN